MTWSDFYLICFIVGFALSVVSVLTGAFDLHLPGLHHGDFGHGDIGHGHVGHADGSHSHGSVLNFATITAFLAWFGGIGFLLSAFSGFWQVVIFILAVAGGAAGAAVIFWFLFKVLLAHDRSLSAFDYEMVGVLGQLTSAIRDGGTGEMSFSQEGVRRSSAARSEDGRAIPKGADVFVTRYEKGIAYVRQWEDVSDRKEIL
jgi:membrane protein implicated in regulation of membrane protease activity